ncbi:MAG: hypothetical protein ACLGQW_00665, partial [Acidobacteriota bacterium]
LLTVATPVRAASGPETSGQTAPAQMKPGQAAPPHTPEQAGKGQKPGAQPAAKAHPYRFGVNADNWKGEMTNPGFAEALRAMGVEFVVWHLSPEEEVGAGMMKLVDFCRANNLAYLFNTELVNYVPNVPYFNNPDGTYRWDLKPATLEKLKDDPLFLGQVYDEAMLMQSLNGTKVNGRVIPPYFVDTSAMTPEEAYAAVTAKITQLTSYFAKYGKIALFEMVYPDYAHSVARAGAQTAPKLMKENPVDLMTAVYAGAARQYGQERLWACVDLWFLDKFPEKGVGGPGHHTPQELYDALCYTYTEGYDWVYVEHIKGLIDVANGRLTAYGQKVVEFQKARAALPRGDWRDIKPEIVVKRFPGGYWGQKYSTFLPDHPYGAAKTTPALQAADARWLELLSTLSGGRLPKDANNWNAVTSPYFKSTPYFLKAGLPPMLVMDHTFSRFTDYPGAKAVDLTR